jgi:hypothetical protein
MSFYNHNLNSVFVHVPRVAGSSIEQVFGGLGHKDIIYFKRFMVGQTDLDFYDAFKFAFVRNPYERFVSGYYWTELKTDINEYASQLAEMYEEWKDDSLEEIIFRPQWKFICNQYKQIQVDFVGRYESLKDDWFTVANKLGLDIKLPHLNKSKRSGSWEKELNSQSKGIIANLYKDDFEVFGY